MGGAHQGRRWREEKHYDHSRKPAVEPLGFKGYPPDGRKLTEEELEACRAVRLNTKEAVIGFALLNGWTLADKAPNPAEKGEIWFKRGNEMAVSYWHEEEVARRRKAAEEYLRRLTEGGEQESSS
jgi:hypothetical protein